MSRLTDLIAQAGQHDPQLRADLAAEIRHLTDRRSFGLNFERHAPEVVELPGRPVRRGDKVRVLPPRGQKRTKANDEMFVVRQTQRDLVGQRSATIAPLRGDGVERDVAVEDLVVVAEFRDPIYPGLVSTGKVERGGGKPFHTVINAENYHALETLLFTHRGKVDCIYIDPPYNTGAKDWKYNNDYVESDDSYRHSKWLSFMERRLKLAKDLLNPDDSVLIVTIDEKEYLRLGLLLEQVFPSAQMQMVTDIISPQGSARGRFFKRSEEYIFFVFLGEAQVEALPLGEEWGFSEGATVRGEIHWASLKRTGTGARRVDREGMFYPVILDSECKKFLAAGEPLGTGISRSQYQTEKGVAVWPIRRDGSEGRWQVGPETLEKLFESGYARLGRPAGELTAIMYLKAGEQKKIGSDYEVNGTREDGSVIVTSRESEALFRPSTVWNLGRHSAGHHGSNLLRTLIPQTRFPFPKSLYAVEDTLRFFVANKQQATIVDFFSGSGTTAHAVMRLNKQDGGRRQCISITNNEVGADEQKALVAASLRPGDPDWEKWGICDYITKPRLQAAITGNTPNGDPIKGDYKFTDEFPMADGFEENVEFFTLTYESPGRVARNRDFTRIAPLLWMAAGSQGRRIDDLPGAGWDVADTYGVLVDLDRADDLVEAIESRDSVTHAFVVTDDERTFQSVAARLPGHVECVRLYEAYLKNFEIQSARSAR